MLKTKWEQGMPYKKLIPLQYAGCTTVAAAQIIAYNAFYQKINGVKMPYDTLRKMKNISSASPYADTVAMLYFDIFDKCDHRDCGENGTLIYPKEIVKYMQSIGYRNVVKHNHPTKFEFDKASPSLNKGYPVLVSALANGFHGHSWVIDGYRTQYRTGSKVGMKTGKVYSSLPTQYRTLVHCNWGLGGGNDGYYYSGVFKSHNPPEERMVQHSDSDGHYDSFYRIVTYEIPK